MKASGASAAGLVLATGQFSLAELYTFTFAIPTLSPLYVTTYDGPLTVGGHTYGNSLLIERGGVEQRVGVEVQELDLDISVPTDEAGPTIAGLSFLGAAKLGYLDSCRIEHSKLVMATPGDVSTGAIPWFQGRVSDVGADRGAVQLTVESDLALLNVAMPRNVIQSGCTHRVFDAGCALNPASFVVSGTVTAVNSNIVIRTSLTQANDYFSLGVLTFTSGVLNGLARTVKRSLNLLGQVQFMAPLPQLPTPGDTFTILPGCDKQQATCSSKFSNVAHYRGYPYVPTPETILGGGTKRPFHRKHYHQSRWASGRRPGG